jgi:RND family efflux transporter MFP subunit
MKSPPIFNLAALAALTFLPLVLQAQVQVRVAEVVSAPIIEELPLSGSVLSPRYSNLSTRESGLVVSLNVDAGDRVEKDELLLQLDADLVRLELQRLQARMEETRLAYEDARRLADEGRRLVEDRNIPRTEYESRLATEAQQEAKLRQLDAELGIQKLKLQHHQLRAPFSGVIGARDAEVGEWLAAGQSALQLVQLDPLRVQASVPERYFGEVRAGTPVTITIDAYPGQPIDAAVDTVVTVADRDSRSFTARMDIPNPGYRLAPGMSADLLFRLGGDAARPVLQVPADAVIRRGDGSAVVWVVRGGQAQPVAVRVGRRNRQSVEIHADDLAAGEQVVTLGNESLRPGQQVTGVEN